MKRYLTHSAAGSTWQKKDHKYIAIKNGRYIYPSDLQGSSAKRTMTSTPANLSSRQTANGVAVQRMTSTPANYGKKNTTVNSYYNQVYGGKRGSTTTPSARTTSSTSSASSSSSTTSSGSGKSAKDYLQESLANWQGTKDKDKKTTKKASTATAKTPSTKITAATSKTATTGGTGATAHATYTKKNTTPVTTSSFRKSTVTTRKPSASSSVDRGISIQQMRGLNTKQNQNSASTEAAKSLHNQSTISDTVSEAKNTADKVKAEVDTKTEAKKAEKDLNKTKKKKSASKAISNAHKKLLKDLDWNNVGKSKTIVDNLLRRK